MSRTWKTATTMLLFMPALSSAVPPSMPTMGTQAFMDQAGMEGLRGVTVGEKLVALYGVPMDQFASDPQNPLSTRVAVDAFLAQNPDVLGVEGVQLAYLGEASTHDGKYTIVTYRQQATWSWQVATDYVGASSPTGGVPE